MSVQTLTKLFHSNLKSNTILSIGLNRNRKRRSICSQYKAAKPRLKTRSKYRCESLFLLAKPAMCESSLSLVFFTFGQHVSHLGTCNHSFFRKLEEPTHLLYCFICCNIRFAKYFLLILKCSMILFKGPAEIASNNRLIR